MEDAGGEHRIGLAVDHDSTMCCGWPQPPLAMTGTSTLSLIMRVSGMS